MNSKLILDQVIQRCQRLQQDLLRVGDFSEAREAALLLEAEIEATKQSRLDRPPVILIAGGTGVGKSALFANLAGLDQKDLSSDIQRPFTTRPNIAATPEERFINIQDKQVNYVGGTPGLVLIDSPDIDSADRENREVTRQLVSQSDIVLYVTIADKRASDDILKEMRAWGPRARWLFALNKVDLLHSQDVDAVREDMIEKLRELGFTPRPLDCFLVSAIKPQHPSSELGRLRNTIYSAPQQQTRQALKTHTSLRRLQNTLQQDAFLRLESLANKLSEAEKDITERVRNVYLEALGTRKTRRSLKGLVREAAWREMPPRIGGPLALAVWFRSRLSNIWLTYSVARLSTSPLSVMSWLRVAASGFGSLARGILPLRTLLHAFRAEHWRQLASAEIEAERQLEDLGIITPTTAEIPQPTPDANGDQSDISKLVNRLLENENTPQQRARTQAAEMLDAAITEHAQETAERVAGWPPRYFGNLLPLALVAHFAYRLVMAWLDGAWLPIEFYLHGLVMFLVSLIPGWFQLGWRMRSLAVAPEPEIVLQYLDAPIQSIGLRRHQDACSALLREITETRNYLNRLQDRLGKALEQIPGSEFGKSKPNNLEDQQADQTKAKEYQ